MSVLFDTAEKLFTEDPERERKSEEILRLASECCPRDRASFLVGVGLGEWVLASGWSDHDIHEVIRFTLAELRAFIERESKGKSDHAPEPPDPS